MALQALVATALDFAGKAPAAVRFVAVHGTGTPLGDPIELGALGAALAGKGGRGPDDAPPTLGSVKACYGHTEGAAGVTGPPSDCRSLMVLPATDALDPSKLGSAPTGQLARPYRLDESEHSSQGCSSSLAACLWPALDGHDTSDVSGSACVNLLHPAATES